MEPKETGVAAAEKANTAAQAARTKEAVFFIVFSSQKRIHGK